MCCLPHGTITTSYHSISTHSLATADGHPSPMVPLCSTSGKLLPPSHLGHWSIGVVCCGVAPALQPSFGGSLTLT